MNEPEGQQYYGSHELRAQKGESAGTTSARNGGSEHPRITDFIMVVADTIVKAVAALELMR